MDELVVHLYQLMSTQDRDRELDHATITCNGQCLDVKILSETVFALEQNGTEIFQGRRLPGPTQHKRLIEALSTIERPPGRSTGNRRALRGEDNVVTAIGIAESLRTLIAGAGAGDTWAIDGLPGALVTIGHTGKS